MSQTLHIVWKDVRRLRWALAIWVSALVGRVVLSTSTAVPTGDAVDAELFFRELAGAFGSAELLLMALIVARLVHEEPLVGLNAFWLTRPYRTHALVAAKLLFAAVVLAALPIVADLATMVMFGAGAPALVRAGSTVAVGLTASILSLMVIAVLTASLGGFVLAIVGLIAGMAILITAVAGVATFWADDAPIYTTPGPPDATPGVVMLATYVCAALAVVLYQYRHRRQRIAVALGFAWLLATVVVPAFWPWPFARAEAIRPGAWADRAVGEHDATWGTEVADVTRFGRSAPRRQVNARVFLSGTPPDVGVQSVGVRARLQLPDGTTIGSSQMGGFAPRERSPAVQAALGGVTLLASVDPPGPREAWSPMITLTEDEFVRHRGRSGRLDATIDFHLVRTRESGALPLTPGAALDDRVSRLEILGLQRRTDSRGIIIRQWRARSPLSTESGVQREFVLRHRSRGEALPGGIENSWPLGGRANAAMLLLRLPFAAMGYGVSIGSVEGGGVSAGTLFLRFPGRGYGKVPQVDPAWYDDAELVVLETVPSGIVTRSLTIEDFAIPLQ